MGLGHIRRALRILPVLRAAECADMIALSTTRYWKGLKRLLHMRWGAPQGFMGALNALPL